MSSFPGEGATDTHMSYLRQELQRLVFDEDCRRKAFNESRIALQEVWDKLVNIRSHISDIRAEVENVRIEAITTSFEGMLWHGDADDQSSKLSLQSASRVAEARHMRDKVRLKEALQAKILAVEEQISGRKQQMLHLSQALKDSAQDLDFHGGRSLAASTLGARSLEIRSQLLSVSKNLNDMEVQLSEFKSEMQRLQQELTQFLQGQQPRKSSTQMPSAQERAAGDWANKKAAYDEIMIELVANGRPFTADLVDELLRHCYALESAEESKADVTWHHAKPQMECSVDEVISSQTQIVRMNGEAPQQYISRLEKRLSTLEYFEVETAQEFQRAVVAVKRFRDLLRDVEFKRCRLELKINQTERMELSSLQVESGKKSKSNLSSFGNQHQERQSYDSPRRDKGSRSSNGSAVRFSDQTGPRDTEEQPYSSADQGELRDLIRTLRFHHTQHGSDSHQTQPRSPKVIIEEETEILALISLYLKEKEKSSSSVLSSSTQIDPIAKHLKLRVLSKLLEQDLGTLNHEEDERHLLEEMWNLADTFQREGRSNGASMRSQGLSLDDLSGNSYVSRSHNPVNPSLSISTIDNLKASIAEDNSLFQTSPSSSKSRISASRHASYSKDKHINSHEVTIPSDPEDDCYPYNTNYNRHGHRVSTKRNSEIMSQSDFVDSADDQKELNQEPNEGSKVSGKKQIIFYLRCSACGSAAQRVVETEDEDKQNEEDESICPECALPALLVERKESVTIEVSQDVDKEDEESFGQKKRLSTAERKLRLSTDSPLKAALSHNSNYYDAFDSIVSRFETALSTVYDNTDDPTRLDVSRGAVREMADRLNQLATMLEHPTDVHISNFESEKGQHSSSPNRFDDIVNIVQQQQLEIERLKEFQSHLETSSGKIDSSLQKEIHQEPNNDEDHHMANSHPILEESIDNQVFAVLDAIEDIDIAADNLLGELEEVNQPTSFTSDHKVQNGPLNSPQGGVHLDMLRGNVRFQESKHLRRLVSFLEDRRMFCQEHREQWPVKAQHGFTNEVDVEIMIAKHLPEMKKLSKSCDPYVEAILLDVVPLPGYGMSRLPYLEDMPLLEQSILRHLVEVEHNLLTEVSKLRVDLQQHELEKSFGSFVRVVEYHRTSTQKQTCYPDWREMVSFKSSHVLHCPFLWLIVRDSSNVGHQLKCKDEIIAQTMWPLSFYRLFDRQNHIISLPLNMPHTIRFRKGRHNLDKNCEIKFGVKLQSQNLAQQMRFLHMETEVLLNQLIRYIISNKLDEDRITYDPLRQRIARLIRAWKLSKKGIINERLGGIIEHKAPPSLLIDDSNFFPLTSKPRSTSPRIRDGRIKNASEGNSASSSGNAKRKSKDASSNTPVGSISSRNTKLERNGPSPSVHKKARHVSPHFSQSSGSSFLPQKNIDKKEKVLPNIEHIEVSLASDISAQPPEPNAKRKSDIDLSIFKASGQNLPVSSSRKNSPARLESRSSWK